MFNYISGSTTNKNLMKKLFLFLFIIMQSFSAFAESRIKDIVYFQGVRDNILVGYGIVVSLNGTGNNLKNSGFIEKGLIDFLEKLGVNNTRGVMI